MTIPLKKGDETISGIGYDKLLEIYEHFASVEGYKPMEVKQSSLPMLLTSKPIDSYADIWEAQDDNWCGKYIEEDTVLFMPMAMPAEKISFRVEKPLCGTRVRVIGSGAERIQEGAPVVTVKDDSHVELYDEKLNVWWIGQGEVLLDGAWLLGGYEYDAIASLQEKIGYYIDNDKAPTITIENAVEGSIDTEMLETGYVEFKVQAVHKKADTPVVENRVEPGCEAKGSYDEVYYCVGHDPCFEVYSREKKTIPATGHSWGEWSVTREPTETVEGEKTRTCKYDARHTETRSIPVISHTHGLVKHDAVAATCTAEGNIEYWVCSKGEAPCGRYFSDAEGTNEIDLNDTVIAALGHSYGDWRRTLDPTCSAEGTEIRTCTRDATHTESRTVAIDPSAHRWGDWEQTKAPTCSVPGEKTRTCEHNNDHKETKPVAVDPDAHDWDEWRVTKAATALHDGEKTRTCKNNAGHQETKAIPAIKDTLKLTDVNNKSNAVGNVISATGKVYTPADVIDSAVSSSSAKATAKFDGKSVTVPFFTASNISGSRTLTGSPEGIEHTISMLLSTRTNPARSITNKAEKTITVITPKLSLSSTCLADGEATITVSGDQGQTIKYFKGDLTDANISKAEEASGNSFTVSEAGTYYVFTAPSQNGDTLYTRSFLSLRDGAVPDSIEVKGHDWSDWMHTKDPTCVAEGEEERSCSNCDKKETRVVEIDKNAHRWNDGKVTTEPTCTEKGVMTYTCEHNNEHTKTADIDALGHDWSEWKVTKAPTQTSEGEEERVCSRCSEKETRAIPKIDPKPAARAVLVAKGIASGKKAVNISWNNVGADRYVIYMSRCNYNGKKYKFKQIKVVNGKTFKMKKSKLKKRTAYKFYVVAQKKSGGSYVNIAKSAVGHFFTGNLRGRYTNPKKLKLKKTAFTLSKGKSTTIKGTVTKARRSKRLATSHAKLLRFTSNNPAVATVNAKGKVTAKSKGTAVIYVQTINGIWKTCKVTVR